MDTFPPTSKPFSYSFPESPLCPGKVQWTGREFIVGDRSFKVLCYDQSQSHWSDELTRLHEEECGAHHPIDIASRQRAVQSLRRWSSRPQPVVLDVGCSSGFLLEALREAFPQATLLGADYIPELLQRLATRLPNIPILQFDLRTCPLPDESVDVVTCVNVLEHIDEDRRALGQIWRILRPGGIAHLEVPAGPHLYDIYDEHLMHHRRYRLGDVKTMAVEAGFEVLEATHLGVVVYPAFAYVKRRNRALLSLPSEEKKRIIATQIRTTGRSRPLDLALKIESALGRLLGFPFGIRCVLALQKPPQSLRQP